MGRSTGTSSQNQSSAKKHQETHPIWRGIGCLMILIIPAISIAAGNLTVNYAIAHRWPIPIQFLGFMHLPDYFYSTAGLRTILNPLSAIPNFYANSAVAFLYMLVLSGVISLIYATVFRMVGPSRYGPTDAPPSKFKATKKSR